LKKFENRTDPQISKSSHHWSVLSINFVVNWNSSVINILFLIRDFAMDSKHGSRQATLKTRRFFSNTRNSSKSYVFILFIDFMSIFVRRKTSLILHRQVFESITYLEHIYITVKIRYEFCYVCWESNEPALEYWVHVFILYWVEVYWTLCMNEWMDMNLSPVSFSVVNIRTRSRQIIDICSKV